MSVIFCLCFLLSSVLCDALEVANNLRTDPSRVISVDQHHRTVYVVQAEESEGSPHDLRDEGDRVRRDAEAPQNPHVTTVSGSVSDGGPRCKDIPFEFTPLRVYTT